MSLVTINILAYLAILTLLSFFGVIAWGVTTALSIVREVKGQTRRLNAPKQATMSIVSTGKGIAQRLAQRGRTIAGSMKAAVGSVMHVKDDVATVVQSIDIDDAKQSAQEAVENARESGNAEAIGFAKQVVDTFRNAQRTQNSGA